MAITDQLNLEPSFTTQSTINLGASTSPSSRLGMPSQQKRPIPQLPGNISAAPSSGGLVDRFSDYIAQHPEESASVLKGLGTAAGTFSSGAILGGMKGFLSGGLKGAAYEALKGAKDSASLAALSGAATTASGLLSKGIPERIKTSNDVSSFRPEIYDVMQRASDVVGVNPMGAYRTNLLNLYTTLPKHLQQVFVTYMKNKGIEI